MPIDTSILSGQIRPSNTMNTPSQNKAQIFAALGLFFMGLWILHGFLGPIVWAIILGITTWPLLSLLKRVPGLTQSRVWAPLILTLVFAGILFGPVTFGLVRLGHETQVLAGVLQDAQQNGLSVPVWLNRLPLIGSTAVQRWDDWLGSSEAFRESVKYILSSDWMGYTKHAAAQLLHVYASVFFTVVILFFVYWGGEDVAHKTLFLFDRVFGKDGSRYGRHAASAVKATVNGIVLVALGQGVALGFGYATAGLDHASLLGLLTGIIAFIPFAAKIMFVGASSVLFAQGHTAQGVGLLVYGLIIILTSDNYIRPRLIGNAVKLPFILTLLGILGGIESFGLLGLFVGPTVMAILISVWRDAVSSHNR